MKAGTTLAARLTDTSEGLSGVSPLDGLNDGHHFRREACFLLHPAANGREISHRVTFPQHPDLFDGDRVAGTDDDQNRLLRD